MEEAAAVNKATTVERNDNHIGEFTVGRLLPLSPPTSDGDNGG
ncbi:hypothetical protein Lalb_Chr25g0282751 [Lupinus albus]|uniref:Uncharacterized protein n=1 Tax=Lupinus albus TaxID=3870 RepID=A0A6A4MYB0_LUPAL|nr:hypothetical protein Lalb_Chr25g0282751 [Lupinus albus]